MNEAQSAGAAHFSRILRAVALTCVVTLSIACVASYVIYLKKQALADAGFDIYAGVRQRTALNYYLVWLVVSLVAFAASLQRRFALLPLYLLLPILMEGAGFLFFFITHHHLYVPTPPILFERFASHPILVAEPRPGDFGFGITHDSGHRRTTINDGKAVNPRLIYVFGGSTTYDTGNVDANTWPSRLSAALGPDFAVENYGLPAYSSMESMLQSLFVFRDHPPACAIYYLGSNDLRNAHVQDLHADYSDMELPHIAAFLQPGRHPGLLATYSVFFSLLGTVIDPPPAVPPVSGRVSDQPDERLLGIFHKNIELISMIGRYFGVRTIFLPDILDYNRLNEDRVGDLPFVKEKDTRKLMDLMIAELKSAARQSGAAYLESGLSADWGDADFFDDAHFTSAGSDKLAKSIAGDVRRLCQ